MSWHHDGTLSSIDAETTGLDIETDRIVTWSRWVIWPSKGRKHHLGWMVDPGIEIPEEAAKIHGITTERARSEGQRADQAVAEIAKDVLHWASEGAVTVAYNAPYDVSLLHRECLRHGHDGLAEQVAALAPVVDPLVIDKRVDRYRKGSRKLTAVAQHYGVPLEEADAHGSQADSLAAARVAYRIAVGNPRIADMAPAELHRSQVAWRAEQAAGLQEYLRRKDPEAVVRPEWPLVPPPEPVQEAMSAT